MIDVFIIGSKGIPAKYGGFETFVEQLTSQKKSKEIRYHVSCQSGDTNNVYTFQGTRCFNVKTPNIGGAKAILYDIASLRRCIKYIRNNNLQKSIIYVLACRIGPFIGYYKRILHQMGVELYVNPDGHEWLRSKWSKPVRAYWKFSERLMVKNADLLICDSKGIEEYIQKSYYKYNPETTFIAYGSDTSGSPIKSLDPLITNWLSKYNIKTNDYYLIVGRFVPENNYELMIREFMKSDTKKNLVIISNVSKNSFYQKLINITQCDKDSRIKFVGTVYDRPLLQKIRELAYGYLHGHEVGGTNPSLLEALSSTKVNLLLDVIFNKEVGEDGALYFNKKPGNLARLIHESDSLSYDERIVLGDAAKKRIDDHYSWEHIVNEYEVLFQNDNFDKSLRVQEK